MFENIPADLKQNGLFCGWKLVPRQWKIGDDFDIEKLLADKNNQTKVPLSVNGGFARSNDRSTFVDFKTAVNSDIAKPVIVNGRFVNGLGLGIFNGYSAVDIDHCVKNGKANDFAQKIIDYFQSYTELSPSRTGIRIIFKTDVKSIDKNQYYINNRKLGLEIYIEGSTAKFVTITGDIYDGTAGFGIVTADPMPIMNEYMFKTTPLYESKQAEAPARKADFNLERALSNDRKFHDLWFSKASGSGGNESETDLALCSKLAFYCQKDTSKMNDLFTSSPYFHSKDGGHVAKWNDRDDYSRMTLDKACEGVNAVYDPSVRVDKVAVADNSFTYTDTGNAEKFILIYGKSIRYNRDNKMWMIWNGLYWEFDVLDKIKVLADEYIENLKNNSDMILVDKDYRKNIERLLSSNGKEMMIKEAQHIPGIPCQNTDFDKEIYWINCRSGVLDLRTGNLQDHLPSLMQSKFCNCEITKKRPEKFLKFLDETFSGDKEVVRYILTVFAICLTGDTTEQKIWYLVGDGSDGKSLLVKVISYVLGDYSATASTDLIIDKKYQSQNISEVARLKGKRMVSISETKTEDKLDEAGVKNMTGGDSIVARFLYCNEFEYTPEFKILMMSNYEPRIVGNDHGIRRRIKIIRFQHTIADEEQDRHLFEKLIAEKDAIFSLLVDYYKEYLKVGLVEPKKVTDWSQGYFKDNDVIQQWIDEDCEIGNGFHDEANNLWADFKIWYDKRNEYFRYSQTLFGRNLTKKYRKSIQYGRTIYEGIEVIRK
jgi:putative DNA primase/helicase